MPSSGKSDHAHDCCGPHGRLQLAPAGDGYALAIESYEWLLNQGFTYFQVRIKPENRVITYWISDFASGYRIDYAPHGEQYALPISKGTESYVNNKHPGSARTYS